MSVFKYKLMVFPLTSFLTGMMGGFYAHYVGMLSTWMLGIDLFIALMVILVIGGVGKFSGAVIGAFINCRQWNALSPRSLSAHQHGALVVILVLVLPDDIVELFERLFSKKQHGTTH